MPQGAEVPPGRQSVVNSSQRSVHEISGTVVSPSKGPLSRLFLKEHV